MSRLAVGRPMEILLVEDGLVDARLTIGNLKSGQVKHRLTLVRDGVEAMQFLHRQGTFRRVPRPDLILLDLQLPKKSGLEVLEELRGDEALRDIPVVVLSGSESPEDMRRCQQLGVESYIVKPVDLDQFISVVKQLKDFWHADLILPVLE